MHCTEFENELNELLDNDQALVLSPAAARHHERCVPCQSTYAAYSKLATAAIIARRFQPVEAAIPTAATVAPPTANRPWSLTMVAAAMVPMAAAMYLLGIGLLQSGPAGSPATATKPGIEANANTELASRRVAPNQADGRTPLTTDFDTQLAIMKRASTFPLPGIPPFAVPVTRGVEAVHDQWKASNSEE